jgi:hypothetical protein
MHGLLAFGCLAGLVAGLAIFSSRSTVIRSVLAVGASLAVGAWIPLLCMAAVNFALGTEYGGNGLGLGLLGFFGSMLGGVVSVIGLILRSWEWVASRWGSRAS